MLRSVKFIVLASALALSGGLCAQQNQIAAVAVVAAGGDLAGNSGSVGYSVGQAVYTAFASNSASVFQGIQRGYAITKDASLGEENGLRLNLSAYPNPTADVLVLEVQNPGPTALRYRLYDAQGVTLEQKVLESQATINMAGLTGAVYFIQITDGKSVVQTFKIVKK